MKKYSENSMTLLKHALYKRFNKGKDRIIFNDDVLWKKFGAFLNEYLIILSTTHSLRKCASVNYLFDYVIIDEASQVDIVTGSLAFSCAKSVVIVGDLKQLPNVVNNKTKEISDSIYNKYKLHEAYIYSENSLLSSICKLYSDVPKTLLLKNWIKNTVDETIAEDAVKILEVNKEGVEKMVANNAFMIDEMKAKVKKETEKEVRKQDRLEIARNLMDILENKTIALKTGLTIDEVSKLRTDSELKGSN